MSHIFPSSNLRYLERNASLQPFSSERMQPFASLPLNYSYPPTPQLSQYREKVWMIHSTAPKPRLQSPSQRTPDPARRLQVALLVTDAPLHIPQVAAPTLNAHSSSSNLRPAQSNAFARRSWPKEIPSRKPNEIPKDMTAMTGKSISAGGAKPKRTSTWRACFRGRVGIASRKNVSYRRKR